MTNETENSGPAAQLVLREEYVNLSLPETALGWWSAALAGAGVVCFGLFLAAVNSGQRGGDTFFSNLWLAGPILAAAAAALAGGATATAAVLLRGDRSLLVLLVPQRRQHLRPVPPLTCWPARRAHHLVLTLRHPLWHGLAPGRHPAPPPAQ